MRSSKKATPQKTSTTCPTDITEVSNKNSTDVPEHDPTTKKTRAGDLNQDRYTASLVLMSAAKIIHLQKILKSTVYGNFESKVYTELQRQPQKWFYFSTILVVWHYELYYFTFQPKSAKSIKVVLRTAGSTFLFNVTPPKSQKLKELVKLNSLGCILIRVEKCRAQNVVTFQWPCWHLHFSVWFKKIVNIRWKEKDKILK